MNGGHKPSSCQIRLQIPYKNITELNALHYAAAVTLTGVKDPKLNKTKPNQNIPLNLKKSLTKKLGEHENGLKE